ncbi:methyltransferase [Streptomyces sp. MAR4 CNX-425]|uniref:methyltransferase n=1 Tax=Streptomyces sp. MAR4 CNX-425 TaxID=3406343 RepID=UPI003B5013F0
MSSNPQAAAAAAAPSGTGRPGTGVRGADAGTSGAYSVLDFLTEGENDVAGRQVAQLFSGYLYTPIAVAIVELGILGRLTGKALTAEEIAKEGGTDPDATARLLRAGMAVGLISGTEDGRFGLTAAGERLGPDAGRLGEMAVLWLEPIREAMAGLAEHVRTGPQVDPAAPGGFWDYLGSHPGEAVKFARAMGYATSRVPGALAAAGYRPPAASRVVDVGGNRGTMLAWLLKELPEAAGVIIDRPEAMATAPDFLGAAGVKERTELVPGSFFNEVPPGDLHLLSRVLHNWDDASVRRIAGNCAGASARGGSLVVIEYVLPSVPEPTVGHLMDVMMMVLYGGRERTLEQHRALIEPAGYELRRDFPVGAVNGGQPPLRVLEFSRT